MKLGKILGLSLFIVSIFINSDAIANEKQFLCSNPGAKIYINSKQLMIRTACSREQLTQGLMNIRELSQNSGMLFVFKDEQILTFWAKDTYIPIDIAYLDNSLEIVSIHTMQPLDRTIVASKKPASYALEVNAGWFQRNNVSVGDKVLIVQ